MIFVSRNTNCGDIFTEQFDSIEVATYVATLWSQNPQIFQLTKKDATIRIGVGESEEQASANSYEFWRKR